MKKLQAVIFSKDRAMQLHATLGSLHLRCKDVQDIDVSVLFVASNNRHSGQYQELSREFPNVRFIPESNFKQQLLDLIEHEFILFLVDDNLFVHDFFSLEAMLYLSVLPQAIGFSLRLGKNTTYCYAQNQPQALPTLHGPLALQGDVQQKFSASSPAVFLFDWPRSTLDFRYPLEVSSSIYRSELIRSLLLRLEYHHPNTLEGAMASSMHEYENTNPILLCYERSVTFCNPLNKVQEIVPTNRYAEQLNLSAETLSEMYSQGLRIDYSKLSHFVPNSCHMEVEVSFSRSNLGAATTDS